MQQLSGLDAAFLYLESPEAPMHVAGVYLFDAATQRKRFDFQGLRAFLQARLHVARTFRQRLIDIPLNLTYPYWIEDPDFDLNAHLFHRVLPKPGSWQALMTLAEQLFSQPLERTRPLWEMTFVEGLNGIEGLAKGSFALIVKVHHAAVDGVSGEEMIWALLDAKPLRNQPHATQAWQPERIPSKLSLLARTAGKTLEQSLNLAKFTGQMVVNAIQVIKEKSFHHTPLPSLPLTAPITPLNAPITSRRTFRAIVLPLHRIQAIRQRVTGVTVNDVVLAICAGALRRYLRAEQTLPDKPLVAAVPISVRSPKRWQDMGNRVSAILVSLATDEPDPSKRLQLIHDSVCHAKRYGQAIDLQKLSTLIPSLTTVLLSRLYSWISPVQWPGPFFNLFITNVPGPQQPFSLGGARLAYHLGMAPIFDGLGLILVITSYLDTLVISATSCPEIMPDPERLIRYLQESFAELDG